MKQVNVYLEDRQAEWLQEMRNGYRASISRIIRHILDNQMQLDVWIESMPTAPAVAQEGVENV